MKTTEIQKFNLWAAYWRFLISLQARMKKRIEVKGKIMNLKTWITSTNGFFDRKGNVLQDYPEIEEIYFRLEHHRTLARISIRNGKTEDANLELVKSDGNYFKVEISIYHFFTPETINEIVYPWLNDGILPSDMIQAYRKTHEGEK